MQYKIVVSLSISFRETPGWNVSVYYKKKGKRLWNNVDYDIPTWDFRKLSIEERSLYIEKNNLRYVTEDEIFETKMELWNKLKPKK